jgi:TolB-like protein/DNA-binding winged helix-turn-helix (wHTH) protein/Flp pilus assembly protein TadD
MHSLRFGEHFDLDPGAYQLRRSGQSLKLERIPMEILLLLTEHRGQLVTREQIVERIWGKDANLDADNSINAAIRKIRQVLKDDPEHPRFIQTITGRGYRWIALVQKVESPRTSVPGVRGTAGTSPQARSSARGWRATGLALLALVIGTAGVIAIRSRTRTAPRVMVAVLPFENLTGDARQDYFSDGLTEETITQLGSRDPGSLGVIARTSVMHYKSDHAPLDRIARELGVQYVLEGSVRRDAGSVRIAAQLIRTTDQTQLWARQYDRGTTGLLTLQGEIAQAIASEIQASLGGSRPGTRGEPVPSAQGFEAYDLYLRGEYAFNKRTVPDLEKAIRFFQQATVTDPTYARAYAALADAYVLLVGYSSRPPEDPMTKARGAALRALQLDSTLPEAHTAMALIVQNYDWDWQTAEREFRRAIALNPNYATAHHWYAEHLMWRGRFAEALEESERARQLDPLSLIIAADNGAILFYSRQYDRAIEKWRSVLDIDPDLQRAHLISAAYVEQGRFAEALADIERQRSIVSPPIYWAAVASVYGRSGRTAEARQALSEMLQASRRRPVQAGIIAWGYVSLGEKDSALAWLERAYAEHSNDMASLKVNPVCDPLRGDPRFQRLLERVGLAQ